MTRSPVIAHLQVPAGGVAEPVVLGLAVPRGRLQAPVPGQGWVRLFDAAGELVNAGFSALHAWPDGSVAWLLTEFVCSAAGGRFQVRASTESAAPPAPPAPLLPRGARLSVTLVEGPPQTIALCETSREATPVSTVGRGEATLADLKFEVRTTRWPELDLLRMELVVHNPRPAKHAGGLWDLGDPGSICIRDLSLSMPLPTPTPCSIQVEPDEPFVDAPDGFVLFQASSGGLHWNCDNHVDATGRVPLAFRGYRAGPREGLRAQPILRFGSRELALSEFWQNFPKVFGVAAGVVRIGLFPAEHGAPHELQGGERKRHTLWMGPTEALGFVATPRRAVQSPAEVVASGVLHGLGLATHDDPGLERHVARVLAPATGFAARRELIDEYGWRHWGDLNADHEAAEQFAPTPFISHYNNQYDCVDAFLLWFLRTGDPRWFRLADPLARHVVDIDLYLTDADRSAYSGGQFWHTDHHRPALTSTHRCYARGNAGAGPYGGGPGNEQNYPSGLWLHHLLTGDPWSRSAALGLADWVLRMDDGHRNVLGLVETGATGAASQTYSPDFHGPGRGAGNSINALCDAWRFTGNEQYLTAAEALIARCVHPDQDLDALDLLDAERRWSYVVFVKYLLKYLHLKESAGRLDTAWRLGRAALVHYARFMVQRERSSTTDKARLEFVTETWPAQDLRKAQVVHQAAAYVPEPERRRFHTWAEHFFDCAFAELSRYGTADRCRPLVLVLHPAIARAYARTHPDEAAPTDPEPGAPLPPFRPFVPQKARVRAALESPAGLVALVRSALRPARWRHVLDPARSPFEE